MDLEELIQLFNKYRERNIDSESAKKLQEYLISRGYDIGFLDTNGNIRKDPDGRLGYKTLEALNREIAILRGNIQIIINQIFYSPLEVILLIILQQVGLLRMLEIWLMCIITIIVNTQKCMLDYYMIRNRQLQYCLI